MIDNNTQQYSTIDKLLYMVAYACLWLPMVVYVYGVSK